jgi:hypothetical protein
LSEGKRHQGTPRCDRPCSDKPGQVGQDRLTVPGIPRPDSLVSSAAVSICGKVWSTASAAVCQVFQTPGHVPAALYGSWCVAIFPFDKRGSSFINMMRAGIL